MSAIKCVNKYECLIKARDMCDEDSKCFGISWNSSNPTNEFRKCLSRSTDPNTEWRTMMKRTTGIQATKKFYHQLNFYFYR